MSLVPIHQSNPIVPEINQALQSAIGALKVGMPQPGYAPDLKTARAARSDAGYAVELLQTGPIYPRANADNALMHAQAGVDKLDSLISHYTDLTPRVTYPEFAANKAVDAIADFSLAIANLNRHSL